MKTNQTVYIDEEIAKKVREVAKQTRRTIGATYEILLEKALEIVEKRDDRHPAA